MSATHTPASSRVAAIVVATLVRVALGVLWVNEGALKYRAGFGKDDILLVAHSTAQNSRVPGFYKLFSANVLGREPALFGTAIPLLETCLGIALIAGVLTLPAALWSVMQLSNYWLADQLIVQYPIMVILAALTAAFAPAASAFSVTALMSRGKSIPPRVLRWL